MRFGSLFTGVGGIDLGLEQSGHVPAFQCEINPYRRRVLRRHWPDLRCFEDVREVAARDVQPDAGGDAPGRQCARGRRVADAGQSRPQPEPRPGGDDDHGIGLLAGGSPCQDLSLAGLRGGLAGERSGLFFEFARCADALLGDGGWILFENVPGLFSSNGGRDFAVVLATLAELGFHDLAWRVLDSRFFGVPQRRRRVFILARRARGGRSAEVLFEREGGGGDHPPRAEAGQELAASLSRGSSSAGVSAAGRRQEDDVNLVAHTLRSEGFDASEDGTGRGTPLIAHSLTTQQKRLGLEDDYVVSALDRRRGGADDNDAQAGHLIAGTVRSHQRPGSNYFDAVLGPAADADGVREAPGLPGRLDVGATCAFDPIPDGPRYEACGDAVTVPVARWIGQRLMAHG